MFKSYKKLILSFFLWLLFLINSFVLAYKVDISSNINDTGDINTVAILDSNTEEGFYQNVARTINDYLWFLTGVLSFWVLIYWGVLLVKSQWDPEQNKKANKILIWSLVWIIVSLLSSLIVRMLINLF
jgi:hypothetical protein